MPASLLLSLSLTLSLSVSACDNGGALPDIDLARDADGGLVAGDLAGLPPGADLSGLPPGADLALPPNADLAPAPDLAPPPPPPADPGAAGPVKTASFSLNAPIAQGINLSILLTGPSDDGKTLSMNGAPFPTVIFSPGFQISVNNYASYANRLASHGFLVVSQTYRSAGNHPQNRDDSIRLVDWLLKPTGNDAARVAGRADPKRIGATGHSLGGKTTFLLAESDKRVLAAIGIDPVNSNPPFGGQGADAITTLGNFGGATGFLGETSNSMGFGACAPAADNYQQFYAKAASPTFAITFVGANHNDFVDQQGCLVCGVCFGGNANKAQTLSLAVKYVTAFFRRHLLGDADMESYLTGAKFGADAAGGAVTEVTK